MKVMRKRFVIVAALILVAPLLGLIVSAVLGARLAVAQLDHPLACSADHSLGFDDPMTYCDQQYANSILWRSSAVLLILTILLPGVFTALAFALGRRREWLANYFPWIVRPTMVGMSGVLVLHGVLVAYTGFLLSVATDYGGFLISSGIIGLGFAGAALLILIEAARPWVPEPLPVIGIVLGSNWLTGLTEQVSRVARRLNVRIPTRIIVGLEVSAFVTTLPLNLRGHGELAAGETLYLPACAIRTLNELQLDALLGHELAHFQGEDLAFTERFVPSSIALCNAIDSVSPDFKPTRGTEISNFGLVAKVPALLLMQLMALVLLHAVNRIRRERELEADLVGAQVSSSTACAEALAKFSLLMLAWKQFRSANAKFLGAGRARPNLSNDYLTSLRGLLSMGDRSQLRQIVLSSRLTHPTDTHPMLAERVRALGLDPPALIDESIDDILRSRAPSEELTALEEALTAIENDWMSVPGTRFVLDRSASLPQELQLRLASRAPSNPATT